MTSLESSDITQAPLAKPHAIDETAMIVNALRHPVLLIDKHGVVRFANAAAEAFFHASSTKLTSARFDTFVPFGSPLLTLIDYARERGAPINEYGVDLSTPQVSTGRPVDIQVAPVPESPEDILVMLQERSMAQKIDRQLNHRGAARSLTGLGSMLAHEVKNPLSGIRGAAQLLEESVDDQDQALTRLIRDEVDRICSLVERMEAFGDDRPVERKPINIHTVLDHVKKIAQNGFAKHIRFRDNFDPSLPPVLGNRDQLIQVFLNLLKNASESIGPDATDGEIMLTTAFRPGLRLSVAGAKERVTLPLEFSVQDNGAGIAPELLPHLFDPFVTSKAHGSGLGLALVAKIIGDHGGVIECDSKKKKTIFRVSMPRFDNAAPFDDAGED
ncbi:MAG: hypothetical protein K8F25_17670 [Fimbriimonadaceae bacterium]|nr:hypothetical protein [Alphaproteobacteria bacterium]